MPLPLPLYKLHLNSYSQILERFVNFYTTSNPKPAQVATFSLKIDDTFFEWINYKSFYSCLRDCGQGLVKLELNIPKNGGSLPGALPNLNLPLLNSLSVTLTGNTLEEDYPLEAFDHPTNILLLMQSILNKVEVLTEIKLYCEPGDKLPPGFDYVGLPSSLKRLEVTCDNMSIVLKLLLKSQLPNLDTLIFTPEYGLPTQTLYQVLEKYKKQLKCLYFHSRYVYEPPRTVTLVGFPVMKNLKELTLWSPHIEPDTHIDNRTFPSLKDLMLYQQTPQMFAELVPGGAPLSSVESLKVQIIDETVSQDDGNTALISLDVMKSIATTFNNISKLALKVCGEEKDAVTFVFKEMTQLKVLRLNVTKHDDIVNSDHWDSVLTGLQVEFIAGLRACPDLWGKVHVDEYEERISVKNLTELSKLELASLDENDDVSEPRTPYLNSDLIFHFALLNMPNLQTLLFRGRFCITKNMLKQW